MRFLRKLLAQEESKQRVLHCKLNNAALSVCVYAQTAAGCMYCCCACVIVGSSRMMLRRRTQ